MDIAGRIKKLFCRHEWVKIAVIQDVDRLRNERYPIRRYQCRKCGRVTHQDGRHDRIAKRAVGAWK